MQGTEHWTTKRDVRLFLWRKPPAARPAGTILFVHGSSMASQQGVTLTLDSVLLHSVCRLLQAAVTKSGWDMELKLPGAEPQAAEERPGRTLN